MENYKIIFHFKSVPNDIEMTEEISKAIKEFHNKSLTFFSEDLDIHIFYANTDN